MVSGKKTIRKTKRMIMSGYAQSVEDGNVKDYCSQWGIHPVTVRKWIREDASSLS